MRDLQEIRLIISSRLTNIRKMKCCRGLPSLWGGRNRIAANMGYGHFSRACVEYSKLHGRLYHFYWEDPNHGKRAATPEC